MGGIITFRFFDLEKGAPEMSYTRAAFRNDCAELYNQAYQGNREGVTRAAYFTVESFSAQLVLKSVGVIKKKFSSGDFGGNTKGLRQYRWTNYSTPFPGKIPSDLSFYRSARSVGLSMLSTEGIDPAWIVKTAAKLKAKESLNWVKNNRAATATAAAITALAWNYAPYTTVVCSSLGSMGYAIYKILD